jgi:hypothetical protein
VTDSFVHFADVGQDSRQSSITRKTLGAVKLPLLDRRLFGIAAAMSVVHFVLALVLSAAAFAFEAAPVRWACIVLIQPASVLVQLAPGELPASLRWAAFGANSLLWGFCIALIGRKWLSKRAAVAAVVFLLALAFSIAGMLMTATNAEWLGLAAAPIWAATMLTSAYLDISGEVATPVIFLTGIVLNAAFLTAIVLVAIRMANRLRSRGA